MDVKTDMAYDAAVKFVKETTDIEKLRKFTLGKLFQDQLFVSIVSTAQDIGRMNPAEITKDGTFDMFKKSVYDILRPLV